MINSSNKIKIKVRFKGVKFGKSSSRPLKGSFIVKSLKSQNKINTFNFSIVSAEQQKKERNSNYNYFSIS